MNLPVISLWQPWAYWVLRGWKTIETRTHARFRCLAGKRIGIHAAQKWDILWPITAAQFLGAEQFHETNEFYGERSRRAAEGKPIAGLVGLAQVREFRSLLDRDAKDALIECVTPRFGLFLEDIKQIKPIAMRGRQGIWNVDVEFEAEKQ